MTPAEVLRGVADALDRGDIHLRMTHPKTAPEDFKFRGDGTTYLGEKDGALYYNVPAHAILNDMRKWLKRIETEAFNEQAEKPRIVAPTGKIALS